VLNYINHINNTTIPAELNLLRSNRLAFQNEDIYITLHYSSKPTKVLKTTLEFAECQKTP